MGLAKILKDPRAIERALNIIEKFVHFVKDELGLHPYKFQNVQYLMVKMKAARLQKALLYGANYSCNPHAPKQTIIFYFFKHSLILLLLRGWGINGISTK